jgi:FeS assembly SUF system protein
MATAPEAGSTPSDGGEISTVEQKLIEAQAIEALRACYDPEIPVNIYELGLVYEVKVSPQAQVSVTMTLTSPACPVAQSLPKEVEARIKAVPGVRGATANVVWTPAWNPSMMSEAAKLELGFM